MSDKSNEDDSLVMHWNCPIKSQMWGCTEGAGEGVVFLFSTLGLVVGVGGRDYAENHFQRKCVLMLTAFLRRPLC